MMTSAIPCIIVLACIAILSSSARGKPIIECLCRNPATGVRLPLNRIVTAKEYAPGPYCITKGVIITLTSGRKVCLDPNERYTKDVLRRIKARDAKNTKASVTVTVPETRSRTVSVTRTMPVTRTVPGTRTVYSTVHHHWYRWRDAAENTTI